MKTVIRLLTLAVAGFIIGGCAGIGSPTPTLTWPHSFTAAPSHAHSTPHGAAPSLSGGQP